MLPSIPHVQDGSDVFQLHSGDIHALENSLRLRKGNIAVFHLHAAIYILVPHALCQKKALFFIQGILIRKRTAAFGYKQFLDARSQGRCNAVDSSRTALVQSLLPVDDLADRGIRKTRFHGQRGYAYVSFRNVILKLHDHDYN